MKTKTPFEKALYVKGYSIKENKNGKKRPEITGITSTGIKVQPAIIESLADYINFVDKLESSFENPVFYRGHGNATFTLNPYVLRSNVEKEHLFLENFERNFSTEMNSCKTNIEKLALMQHFGLRTRALDISESALVSLYFACSPMKKFNTHPEEEKKCWGEVLVFRNPEEKRESKIDNIKTMKSPTISIIAGTAFMEREFSLWQLGMEWKKDNNYMREEIHLPLKDILCRSTIVRLPMTNQRISNQRGAFIMVNANEITSINGNTEKTEDLFDYIMNGENITFDHLYKISPWRKHFRGMDTWELKFKKVIPYSDENKIKQFRIDPFDIQRLFYRDKNGVQQVALIPPEKKDDIIKELEKLCITEAFIYPDMDNVANEINNQLL